jgi:c-di-GMP-binding flagellar brake protein YcgR
MVALLQTPTRSIAKTGAERRVFTRRVLHLRVEGKRLDHSIQAHREPHLSLALRDLSAGGMSALSQTPLSRGERLSVFFPPQGADRGWDAFGRVVSCEPSGLGYRVAMEFDSLPAA